MTERTYYVAHVRGADYKILRNRGFVVLYPAVDDYVFLEVKPENEKLLRKQSELAILFLKNRKGLRTITQKELDKMQIQPSIELCLDQAIKAVSGIGQYLEGTIKAILPNQRIVVLLNGYRRVFELEVDAQELLPLKLANIPQGLPIHEDT